METLVLIGLTAFVFYRLWNVLGTRTGHEKSHDWKFGEAADKQNDDNVIVLSSRSVAPVAKEAEHIIQADLIQALKEKDSSFDEEKFLRGAARAFEQIVLSYAKGDHAALKKLVSADVFDKFETAIAKRQDRNETVEAEIASVDAEIQNIEMKLNHAFITVRFKSEQMLATISEDGQSFDNPARLSTTVTDTWTFTREFTSHNKMWILVKTEAQK
jgi:predicted lipid-binding transport protein (Tim44 family)